MKKLKVTSGMNPSTTKILLDGEQMEGVTAINVYLDVDNVPTAKVDMFVRETDIEIECLVELYTVIKGVRYRLMSDE